MATYLYRLGGWAFRRRRLVVALWGLALALVIGAAATFGGQTSNKFEVPGTESQQAQDLLAQKFPAASVRINAGAISIARTRVSGSACVMCGAHQPPPAIGGALARATPGVRSGAGLRDSHL